MEDEHEGELGGTGAGTGTGAPVARAAAGLPSGRGQEMPRGLALSWDSRAPALLCFRGAPRWAHTPHPPTPLAHLTCSLKHEWVDSESYKVPGSLK